MKTVLVPLANGFEEIEAITIIDVLRRAHLNVITAGSSGNEITGAHQVKVLADKSLNDISHDTYDALILPGGMPGTTNLLDSPKIKDMIKRHYEGGQIVAAICAAPWVLSNAGILDGKNATIYPGMEDKLSSKVNKLYSPVVQDGNVITSRGPGTAFEFSFKLVELLVDKSTASNLMKGMIYK